MVTIAFDNIQFTTETIADYCLVTRISWHLSRYSTALPSRLSYLSCKSSQLKASLTWQTTNFIISPTWMIPGVSLPFSAGGQLVFTDGFKFLKWISLEENLPSMVKRLAGGQNILKADKFARWLAFNGMPNVACNIRTLKSHNIAECYKHKSHKTERSKSFVSPQDKWVHWTTLVKLANVLKA